MMLNILLLNVLLFQIYHTINGRNVFIDVKSQNWHSYPVSFVSELSEFISEQSQFSYWKFIDDMCMHSDIIDNVINHSINNNDIDINGENVNIDSSSNLHDLIAELQTLSYEIAATILPTTLHAMMDTSIGLSIFLFNISISNISIYLSIISIGLGTYSPTIKFYQTLSEPHGNPCNGSSYIVTYPSGKVSCSLPFVSINSNERYPEFVTGAWEHNYEANDKIDDVLLDKNELSHIILYGIIGSSSYCSLHKKLSAQCKDNLIKYSTRHAYPDMTPISSDVRLQGYGVFLDIKNMEYKNVDDRVKSDSDDGNNDISKIEEIAPSFPENEEIMGIVFSKVYERHSNYGGELTVLREQILKKSADGIGTSEEMKVWKMKDLGLQSLQSIILQSNKHVSSTLSNSQLAIDKLTDIVQNFPKVAALLSSIKVDRKIRSDVQEYWSSSIPSTVPSNAIFINGVVVDLTGNTFNIYDLLNTIKDEILKMNKLESLDLPVSLPPLLKNIASSMNSDVISTNPMLAQFGRITRIDISKGGKHTVNFINNLERDSTYKKWPKSLRVLNQPSWSLQSIAKNLYTLVIVIDPSTVAGASLFLQVYMMWQQEYPVRFGFVLACPSDNTDICRLYKYLSSEYGSVIGYSFLASISTYLQENYGESPQHNDMYSHYMEEPEPIKEIALSEEVVINRDVILEIYSSSIVETNTSKSLNELTTDAITLLSTSQFNDYLKNTTLYIEARGLAINSYSLNGIVDGDGDLSNIMQVLAREQFIITQLYQSKKINDRTKSLFSTILSEFGAYTRYHRILDDSSSKEHISVSSAISINYLSNLHYYYPIDNEIDNDNNFINTTIIIAMPSYSGLKSIASGFEFIKSDPNSRVSFSFNINQARCSMTGLNDANCIQDIDVIQRIGLIHNINDYNLNSNSMQLIFQSLSDKDVALSDIIDIINQEINNNNNSNLKGVNGQDIRKLSIFSHTVASINKDKENDYIELDKIIIELIQLNILSSKIYNIHDTRANHVIYNTRKIHSYGDNAFHYLDYSLLASLEFSRYGNRLLTVMKHCSNENENSCKNKDLNDNNNTNDVKLKSARGSNGAGIRQLNTALNSDINSSCNGNASKLLNSMKLLILSSFCGEYSVSSSSKRYNIMDAINENELTNSSLLFHVNPLHDVFIDTSVSVSISLSIYVIIYLYIYLSIYLSCIYINTNEEK
jgi:UDP-glucose:glycoprotein glucosyltransferase